MKPALIRLVAPMLVALAGTAGLSVAGDRDPARVTSLRTVEGVVVSLSAATAEGDLEVVAATLDGGGANGEKCEVLLAPKGVLDELEFEVAPGDQLRARIFVADEGAHKVHKAMNLTRGTMVRFRSLREVPLWNTTGGWEGGPCRQRGGYGGGYQRRGQGSKR